MNTNGWNWEKNPQQFINQWNVHKAGGKRRVNNWEIWNWQTFQGRGSNWSGAFGCALSPQLIFPSCEAGMEWPLSHRYNFSVLGLTSCPVHLKKLLKDYCYNFSKAREGENLLSGSTQLLFGQNQANQAKPNSILDTWGVRLWKKPTTEPKPSSSHIP